MTLVLTPDTRSPDSQTIVAMRRRSPRMVAAGGLLLVAIVATGAALPGASTFCSKHAAGGSHLVCATRPAHPTK
jgi:hypothetical protein